MIPRLLQILLLLLIVYPETAAYDCLQYSKQQYTTIVSCPVACEYSYKAKRTNEKWSGGCSTSSDKGCRTRGDVTVCTCTGDRCNEQGYKMDSGEDEK